MHTCEAMQDTSGPNKLQVGTALIPHPHLCCTNHVQEQVNEPPARVEAPAWTNKFFACKGYTKFGAQLPSTPDHTTELISDYQQKTKPYHVGILLGKCEWQTCMMICCLPTGFDHVILDNARVAAAGLLEAGDVYV